MRKHNFGTKLIRSFAGKETKPTAVYLVDGTKIRIDREGNGAWLEIGPTPEVAIDSPQPEMSSVIRTECCEKCGDLKIKDIALIEMLPCKHECHWSEKYGFVSEAGCPIHNP